MAGAAGVLDADRQEDGEQELSGEEPRGGRDARLHVDDLLRQDWHADPEQDDRGSHVVRRPHHRGGHQRRSVV